MDKPIIVVDIETCPRPRELQAEFMPVFTSNYATQKQRDAYAAKKEAEWYGKAALDAKRAHVLTIQYLYMQKKGRASYDVDVCNPDDGTEKAALMRFWKSADFIRQRKGVVVGHNIIGFDIPFMIRRSMYHRVEVPKFVFNGSYIDRSVFKDTMREFQLGTKDWESLDRLARFFGVGKKETSGKYFWQHFLHGTPEEREEAERYAEQDVRLCCRVAAAMGIIPYDDLAKKD